MKYRGRVSVIVALMSSVLVSLILSSACIAGTDADIERGKALQNEKKFCLALDAYRDIRGRHPERKRQMNEAIAQCIQEATKRVEELQSALKAVTFEKQPEPYVSNKVDLGWAYLGCDKIDEAVAVYRELAKEDVKNAINYHRLAANCFARDKRYKEAVDELRIGLSAPTFDKASKVAFGMYKTLVQCGPSACEWDLAVEACRNLAAMDPDRAGVWLCEAGRIRLERNRVADAESEFSKAVEAARGNGWELEKVRLRIGQAYAGTERRPQAVSVYRKYAEEDKDKAGFWLFESMKVGKCSAGDTKAEECIAECKELWDKLPLPEDANLKEWVIRKLSAIAPKELKQISEMGKYLETKDRNCAASFLCRAGVSLMNQKNYDDAIAVFEDVVARFKGSESAMDSASCIIESLGGQGKYQEALARADALFKEREDLRGSVLLGKGFVMAGGQDYKGAREAMLEVVSKYPQHHMAYKAMLSAANYSMAMKDIPAARQVFQDGLKVKPANPELADECALGLARCLYSEGHYEEAKKELSRIAETAERADARAAAGYVYGQCCIKLGDKQSAKEAFEKVSEEYPGTLWARGATMLIPTMSPATDDDAAKKLPEGEGAKKTDEPTQTPDGAAATK